MGLMAYVQQLMPPDLPLAFLLQSNDWVRSFTPGERGSIRKYAEIGGMRKIN